MSFCDFIQPPFYQETRRKARKVHRCCETGQVILPGDHYWDIRVRFEKKLLFFRQTEGAYHFARWLNGVGDPKRINDVCIPFGEIYEYIHEVNDPDLNAEWERVKMGEVTRTT